MYNLCITLTKENTEEKKKHQSQKLICVRVLYMFSSLQNKFVTFVLTESIHISNLRQMNKEIN